ncbi:alpha-galactosidase [Granulicella cerasi]|uniref:Alpha-galactosidase n=1 Tax=Granulicella cerasi TaxID=741063 RepID=A0ABW1ZBW2_9BACT|nr:alpha-galactosidase [Granulicella cerasi]
MNLVCLRGFALGLLAAGVSAAVGQSAAARISYNPESHVFRLSGGDAEYAFGVNSKGALQTVYWGGRLAEADSLPQPNPVDRAFEIDDTPQEFAGWGGGLLAESALKITFADGDRDLVLRYQSHTLRKDGVDVLLRDLSREVYVTLHYTIDADTGILARSATVENRTKATFTVEQASAAQWNLPASAEYQLRYLAGRWAGEDQLESRSVTPGSTVLESRRGTTGHEFAPWFALARNSAVTERDGEVWFGSLAWSGSWRITVEQDPMQQVRITGGYNPFDFAYPLKPGERLETPIFYGGVTQHGYGDMSRLESLYQRRHILPHGPNPKPRPVLYNSWEATEFRVSEANQMALAEKAAAVGVERFVMDDGWFSTRKNDRAGLGDWWVDKQKFPQGLKPLIEKVHDLGMDFGLWVEPEMVNENSEIYRQHPDWIIHFEGRPSSQARHQFVLNLALPAVQEHLFQVLDTLVTDNDIAFLKWDANRNWSEPGWPQAPVAEQKKLYVEYVRGYYALLRKLREKHPKLEIESCSGGGGRVDLGVMALTDEVWPSDNTDPFDRLLIQDGFSYAYTTQAMMAWVTDSPNWVNHRSTSLEYRFLSSMQGSLGLGADLTKWSAEDVATARHMITEYKNIRSTVQQGRLYRLVSPRSGSDFSSTEYVSGDGKQAVVFAFLHSQQMGYPAPQSLPEGLDPAAFYTIRMISGKLTKGTPARASGAFWMQAGLHFELNGDYSAAAAELSREP